MQFLVLKPYVEWMFESHTGELPEMWHVPVQRQSFPPYSILQKCFWPA